MPFDAEHYAREISANWRPLVELYNDERRADGTRRIRALFRLFEYREELHETSLSVPLLYSARRTAERSTHDVLFGLFRYGSGQGGTELRLLWLPLLRPEASS